MAVAMLKKNSGFDLIPALKGPLERWDLMDRRLKIFSPAALSIR